MRRSARLGSKEPEYQIDQDIDRICKPSRARKPPQSDANATLLRFFAGNWKAKARELTADERKAIIDGLQTQNHALTSQNTSLTSQSEDLQERLAEVTRERDRARKKRGSRLRAIAAYANINAIVAERERAAAAAASQESKDSENELRKTPEPKYKLAEEEKKKTQNESTQTPKRTHGLINAVMHTSPPTQIATGVPASTPAATPHTQSFWRRINPLSYLFTPRGPGAADSRPANLDQPSEPLGELTPLSRKRTAPMTDTTSTRTTTADADSRPAKRQRATGTERARTEHATTTITKANAATDADSRPAKWQQATDTDTDQAYGLGAADSRPANLGQPRRALTPASRISRKQTAAADTDSRPAKRKRAAVPDAYGRYDKMERYRHLMAELTELEQDGEIREMKAHRLKRVKVDKLLSIPHRGPGDSEGTFAVPEIDSDSEVEVGEDEMEVENIFEMEAAKPYQQPEFTFPSVGKLAAGEVGETEGVLGEFRAGLAAWTMEMSL